MLLDCDEKGRMRYSLSVPERALPAVRSALGVFDRVQPQVTRPGEPRASKRGPGRVQVVRAELRLARPSSEPLAHLPLTPDPLQSFARVHRAARSDARRAGEVAVDLLPATPATRRRLRRRLLKEARRRGEPSTRRAAGREGFSLDGDARRVGSAPRRRRWSSSEPSGRRSRRSCGRPSRCFGCRS